MLLADLGYAPAAHQLRLLMRPLCRSVTGTSRETEQRMCPDVIVVLGRRCYCVVVVAAAFFDWLSLLLVMVVGLCCLFFPAFYVLLVVCCLEAAKSPRMYRT